MIVYEILTIITRRFNMDKSYWVAVRLVETGKGTLMNRWVCRQCEKNCVALLPLSEEPGRNCKGV